MKTSLQVVTADQSVLSKLPEVDVRVRARQEQDAENARVQAFIKSERDKQDRNYEIAMHRLLQGWKANVDRDGGPMMRPAVDFSNDIISANRDDEVKDDWSPDVEPRPKNYSFQFGLPIE